MKIGVYDKTERIEYDEQRDIDVVISIYHDELAEEFIISVGMMSLKGKDLQEKEFIIKSKNDLNQIALFCFKNNIDIQKSKVWQLMQRLLERHAKCQ